MNKKQDKITKEQLVKMLEKVPESSVAGDSLEAWQRVAPYFARHTMQGINKAVLELGKESRSIVFKEAGAAFCEGLLECSGKKWQTEGLPEIARAGMAGIFKGVLKLNDEDKQKVFRAMGEACFHRFNQSYRGYADTGISFTAGGYEVDAAILLIKSQLACRKVWREGDTIFWDADVGPRYGGCTCCLVQAGITEPVPEVCLCADWVMKIQFEYLTGIPMESERVTTINTGSGNHGNCAFKVHINPANRRSSGPTPGKKKL